MGNKSRRIDHCRLHAPCPEEGGTTSSSGHHVLVRRAIGGRGHAQPQRHEPVAKCFGGHVREGLFLLKRMQAHRLADFSSNMSMDARMHRFHETGHFSTLELCTMLKRAHSLGFVATRIGCFSSLRSKKKKKKKKKK